MTSEQRWCPACGHTTDSSDSWDCSDCGTRLWTHEMIWRELREALSLRPPSKGAKYAEAGRLRLDLYHSQQRVEQLEAELEAQPSSSRIEALERDLENSERARQRMWDEANALRAALLEERAASTNGQLRRAATVTVEWLRTLAKGSSPKKSVLLADLNRMIGELQAGLKEER